VVPTPVVAQPPVAVPPVVQPPIVPVAVAAVAAVSPAPPPAEATAPVTATAPVSPVPAAAPVPAAVPVAGVAGMGTPVATVTVGGAPGELPFTGLDGGIVAFLGMLTLLLGMSLRQIARRRES